MMTELFCIPSGLPVDIYKHINDFMFGYDPHKHTPSHMADTNNLEGVKWIVQHKKWSYKQINEALQEAVWFGRLDMMKYLISQGADVTADDDWVFQCAAQYGYLEVVQYLVSQGVDVTANDNEALRYAALFGHLEVVQYLVSQGADVTARDNWAVRFIAENEHLEVVQYLVSQGAVVLPN